MDVKKRAFRMWTPKATANVDGTRFTMSYDVATSVTGVMVEEGRVTVQATNATARAATLAQGEYIAVEGSGMTAVLAAPGGSDKVAAHPQADQPAIPPNINRDNPAAHGGRYLSVRLNGRSAVLDWSNSPTSSGSWVSIVPVGTSDGAHAGRWLYTQSKPSGRFENGPLDPGSYETRFYSDGGYGQLVDRVRFDVVARALTGGQQGQILRVQNTPDIAGTWTFGTEWVYIITQNGPNFTWSLARNSEKAEGTIAGKSVFAKWSGPASTRAQQRVR